MPDTIRENVSTETGKPIGAALLGLPMWPTTLVLSQTIPTGYVCALEGTLTIPQGITLTIEGTGLLTLSNRILLQ